MNYAAHKRFIRMKPHIPHLYGHPKLKTWQEQNWNRFMDPSWFVEWVQIKKDNGDQYRCNVNGWIDHRFVFVQFLVSNRTGTCPITYLLEDIWDAVNKICGF